VELHHAGTPPAPVRRWAGIPVDGDDVVAAAGQRSAEEQAGGAGSDDRDPDVIASFRARRRIAGVSLFRGRSGVNGIRRLPSRRLDRRAGREVDGT